MTVFIIIYIEIWLIIQTFTIGYWKEAKRYNVKSDIRKSAIYLLLSPLWFLLIIYVIVNGVTILLKTLTEVVKDAV